MTTDTTNTTDTNSTSTTQGRDELIARAKESVTGAAQSAVDAVKANPKTAAAIAVGATAAVAGAVLGASKLAAAKDDSGDAKKGSTAKK